MPRPYSTMVDACRCASADGVEYREKGPPRPILLDACAATDERCPGAGGREEGVDERRLADARLPRHEDGRPAMVAGRPERGLENVDFPLASDDGFGDRLRRRLLMAGRPAVFRVYVLDLGDEAIAPPHHGLDSTLTKGATQIANVGPEQALAHRDLPPHGLDDLRVRHQP